MLLLSQFKFNRFSFIQNFIQWKQYNSFILNYIIHEVKDMRLLNHHFIVSEKSHVKTENISVGSPVCGLRITCVAYWVHSRRSEVSFRIKKYQFVVKCMSIAPRSVVWLRNFFITANRRARSCSGSKSAGRESFERHLSRLPAGVWTILGAVRKR